MASDASTIDRSILLRQWTWPLRVAFWVIVVSTGLWIFGMLAQAGWARYEAGEDAVRYQSERVDAELQVLARLQPQLVDPMAIARWIGTSVRGTAEAVAVVTSRTFMNIPGRTREFASSEFIRNDPDPGGAFARELLAKAGADWDLLVLSTYGFAIRTAVYAAILPMLIVCCSLGVVDGLVFRARRKANAGRESSSLYHRAKFGVTFALITAYLIALVLPRLEAPTQLLFPTAGVVAGLLGLQAAFYKKYF